MKGRAFRYACAGMVVSAALASAAPSPAGILPLPDPPPQPPPDPPLTRRPNVVVIMTDDQTAADMRFMPRTRRLIGRAGATFAKSYASFPLCCPSRATLLTGRYAHNHNVLAQGPPLGGYGRLNNRHTIAVWLKKAGYHTTHIGKFLNGYGAKRRYEVPRGWHEWRASVDPTTYRYWGYTLNENGRLVTYGRSGVENPRLYQTDVYARKAARTIRHQAGHGPFFLNLAFVAPHVELGAAHPGPRAAPRHVGRYANRRLPRPPSFNERDVSDKPRFFRGERLGEGQIRSVTRRHRHRLASLLAVDEAVARVVQALRDTGELRRTFVFFTSDNGLFHGEHRIKTGKFFGYEAASRVPLLVRGPGIPHGAVSDELVANIDLAPTIVGVAQASPTRRMDGRSLLRFARDPDLLTTRPLLLEAKTRARPPSGDRSNPGYKAIRSGRWIFVRWVTGEKELYDLERDPHQLRSLHAHPRYRGVRKELARQLGRLADCGGGACRTRRPAVPPP